jgi:hypothetical protein
MNVACRPFAVLRSRRTISTFCPKLADTGLAATGDSHAEANVHAAGSNGISRHVATRDQTASRDVWVSSRSLFAQRHQFDLFFQSPDA